MSPLTVVSLFPERLNIHGDAENAAVLVRRASWRGLDASLRVIADPADAADVDADLVTIGAGFDADAPEILDGLRGMGPVLRRWRDAGVPLLAVGLGWDMLSTSVELESGAVPGMGLFPGRSVASARRVGTIAVDSDLGPLTGYEYHLRDYILAGDERPLGTVRRGTGNLAGAGENGAEGSTIGSLVGTGLRGPVLARNPGLADDLLDKALVRRGESVAAAGAAVDAAQALADLHALRANEIVRRNLGL
ncbi:hypothetical protein RYJ27_06125 [Microbacterium limosum]|uniref:Lipid II isoglutaminyl synthase (glutamine-hydrolyzing) subunit GatD n=1 Tax=Microbacterium limosum TaxID=3079935 RepID=A0AAU0MJW9_9MICO|nr:hypothetical protein [Microbacterium sp. Y20]WOQ70763.1 hypothetical protein RYJ27_06125 [Microbacterium sp. Y20]